MKGFAFCLVLKVRLWNSEMADSPEVSKFSLKIRSQNLLSS